MKILVDADACPVIDIIERIAKKNHLPVILLCDTNHMLYSDYSEIKVVGDGTDAVDFALMNICKKDDVVVTQDYGLAAMVLGKGARCIHHSGRWYTSDNIDRMLMERHIAQKERRTSHKNHIKSSNKREGGDDIRFAESFLKILSEK